MLSRARPQAAEEAPGESPRRRGEATRPRLRAFPDMLALLATLPIAAALRVTPTPLAALRVTPTPPTCACPRGVSCRHVNMLEEPQVCTEENVAAALADFKAEALSMFGCHPATAAIGITGDLRLASMDGPFITVELAGRFWHRRETVLANAEAYVRRRIPEVVEVDVAGAHNNVLPALASAHTHALSKADQEDLLDVLRDDETGTVIEDRRAPDITGDREAMEYQGIDPDNRGPFGKGTGGFRPGGSMLS